MIGIFLAGCARNNRGANAALASIAKFLRRGIMLAFLHASTLGQFLRDVHLWVASVVARHDVLHREDGDAVVHHRALPLLTCSWNATRALEHSMSRRRTKSVCTRASALGRRWMAIRPPRQPGP